MNMMNFDSSHVSAVKSQNEFEIQEKTVSIYVLNFVCLRTLMIPNNELNN